MDIEKLDYDPGYTLNITATITDKAIEFEERCMGEALRRWHITKEDVLRRAREADRLRAENDKLRAELEQVKMECDAAQSLLAERIGVRGAEPITTAFGLPISRLRELAQADREGRCVVLPCKVEDDVYINILGRTLPFTVISVSQMASTPTFKAQHGIRLVYIFKADDVGETVFLTRAEAEAALRREQK